MVDQLAQSEQFDFWGKRSEHENHEESQLQAVVVNVRSQILAVVAAAAVVPTQHVRLPPLHPSHPTQLGYDGILL